MVTVDRWIRTKKIPHKGPVAQKMFPFDNVIMTGFLWTTFVWVCNTIRSFKFYYPPRLTLSLISIKPSAVSMNSKCSHHINTPKAERSLINGCAEGNTRFGAITNMIDHDLLCNFRTYESSTYPEITHVEADAGIEQGRLLVVIISGVGVAYFQPDWNNGVSYTTIGVKASMDDYVPTVLYGCNCLSVLVWLICVSRRGSRSRIHKNVMMFSVESC